MDITFVDVRNQQELADVKLEPGVALMGLNIKEGSTPSVTTEGVPKHKVYSGLQVVSFGVERLQKQEERNSVTSVAGQANNFRVQNPSWKFHQMFRPIYDVNPDDVLATMVLDTENFAMLQTYPSKLRAILCELQEWSANRYAFVQHNAQPCFLNNLLNSFPFPFRELQDRSRVASVRDYFFDQQAFLAENFERLEPVARIFPQLKYDVLFRTERSALLLVMTERYGADDLIAQMYFEANPAVARVIVLKKMFNSVKHSVQVLNSTTFSPDMVSYPYPDIKELNTQEKKADGDPSWKNLKMMAIGPRKGTSLPLQTIWSYTALE